MKKISPARGLVAKPLLTEDVMKYPKIIAMLNTDIFFEMVRIELIKIIYIRTYGIPFSTVYVIKSL